jgi:phytanoyl-CoA hydroxylase
MIPYQEIPNADALDVVLEPGQLSIHDPYLLHASAPNQSSQRRAGIVFRYMPTTSFYDHDLSARKARDEGAPDLSQRPLYMMRGVDRYGRNDFERGKPQ